MLLLLLVLLMLMVVDMQPLLLLLDQGKLGKLVLIPLDLDLLLGYTGSTSS